MVPVREVRDPSTPQRPAVLVGGLIVMNILAFLFENAMIGAGDRYFALQWGLVPRILTEVDLGHGILTIFTSMFLHGGWFHLLGNLWFLWIFGRSVEDALGHARFALLYVVSGVCAALVQVVADPVSRLPMLGASGAIGGVLGAYVSLFPMRRISTLVPILVIPLFLPIPAFLFVFEWFAINLLRGIGSLELNMSRGGDGLAGGVAWWAHVGGFLGGLLLVRLLYPRVRVGTEPPRHAEGDLEVLGPYGRRYRIRRHDEI